MRPLYGIYKSLIKRRSEERLIFIIMVKLTDGIRFAERDGIMRELFTRMREGREGREVGKFMIYRRFKFSQWRRHSNTTKETA